MQESLEASLVRIRTADGRVVGAGFLVGERHILTCTHVISQALGLPDSPADAPQGVISLDFPLVSPHTFLTACVVQWCPPLSDGRGDIAGLELQGDPPTKAEVVRFAPADDVWKHEFSVLGFPTGYDDGVWATGRLLGRQAMNWIQIEDVKAQGFAVAPGFSGTPVWDTQLQGVVGMVVAASRPTETRTAFVIPLDVLAAAWPLLTVPPGKPRNPYKGLRPFTQHDAADFFGREAVVEKVAELVNSLVTDQPARSSTRLLTILGPSGAGKSSLVMAGLLPQLQRGMLPGSETWLCLDPMVPGKHPLESLVLTLAAQLPDRSFSSIREDLEDESARGLHQLCTHLLNIHRREQPGARIILLVDQFEELFTQTESEDERQRFIHLLLTACSEPRGPLVALLTLRADFYDRPMQYPDLFRLIDTQHLSLLSIEPGDLRRVVEQPAALPDVQVTFEGDLVNRLLTDVQGQVGALPLLQFTLDQLFQRRSGRQLTLSAYRELGGVKGALAKQAEETYTTLPSEEHRKLARALFARLIDPGAAEQDTTRRRAALSEFTLDDPTQTRLMRETIDAFIAARLLTTNEIAGTTTIEVSHEALIREWPRLAGWLREAREDIHLQQTISKDATNWEQHNKPGDRLYRGSQLKEAQVWAKRNTTSKQEQAFLQASAAGQLRSLIAMIAVILLVVTTSGIAGWFFLNQPHTPDYVTTTDEYATGSLRWAIGTAHPGDTITFDPSLAGQEMVLKNADIHIFQQQLTIRGPATGRITIREIGAGLIVDTPASVTISDVAFQGSNTKDQPSLIQNQGKLTLTNCTIYGNTGTNLGGGIFNNGTLTLTNSTVSGNTATGVEGGGILNQGALTLTNSTVSGNKTTAGGGIYNAGGTLTLSNSTVSGNTSQYGGGGIDNLGGTLTLTNSTVSGNRAIAGGGIDNSGTLTLSNSTVSGNTSQYGGGGIFIDHLGTLTLSNSTVSDNTASDGGGIYNYSSSGTLTLNNSTISGNKATGNGGGIAISTSEPIGVPPSTTTLLYCTVYDNTANVGGGIWIGKLKLGQVVTIGASIVAGNNAHTSPNIEGPLTTLGYNLVGDRSGATFLGPPNVQSTDKLGVSTTDLKIDPVLRDNGGAALPHTRTHALLSGSRAIDLIPPDVCMMFKVFNDQRGMKRPDENESKCDIGAYESSP